MGNELAPKVYVYVRVSSDSQSEGDGIPRQTLACREYAKRHGLEIAAIYREDFTGTEDTMRRPAWSAMMDAILTDGVRTVLVERLDRLSRSVRVQEVTIYELEKQGIGLLSTHAAEEELMSKDGSRVAFRQMMGVFAEYDRYQLVQKLRVARLRKRAADGRCEGRKRYGFRPGEGEIVARIKRWHSEGVNMNQIALRLNEANVRARAAKQWSRQSVREILRRG